MSANPLANKAQAWSALFSEPMSELVKRYTASVFFDKRMAAIKQMHRILYRQNLTLAQAQAEVGRLYDRAEGDERVDAALMRDFLAQAGRGIVR